MNDPSAADRPKPARARLRRWGVFAAVGLLALLAVLAHQAWTAAGSPGRGEWTAYSILYIAAEEPSILPDPKGLAPLDERRWERYRHAQAAMVKSRLVLNVALRTPGVKDLAVIKGADDPIDWLQKNLQVSFQDGEEFMRISVAAGTPQEGELVVTAVSDAYLNEVVDKERRLRLHRMDQLKDLLTKYNESLSRKENSLRNIKKVIEGAGHPTEDELNRREDRAYYRKELRETDVALMRAKIRLECLSEKPGGDEVKAETAKLRDEVVMLTKLRESLARAYNAVRNEKDVVNLNQADLESLQREIAQERRVADQLAEEQEVLKVKTQEGPRVRKFQEAVATRTR
jgi:hypothetical protein